MPKGVAILVAVLLAAGPGACCCLPRAVAAIAATPAATSVAPVKHACPFCPAEPAPEPGKPDSSKPACPCGERLLSAPVAAPDAPVLPDPHNLAVSHFDSLPAFGVDASTDVVGPQSDMPFLPPKDRLMVHHALRL